MADSPKSTSAVGTWTTVGLAALLILVSVLYVKVRGERDEARSVAGTRSSARSDGPVPSDERLAAARADLAALSAQAKLAKSEHTAALERLKEERDALAAELESATGRLAAVRAERDAARRSAVDLEDALAAVEATLILRERELARTR